MPERYCTVCGTTLVKTWLHENAIMCTHCGLIYNEENGGITDPRESLLAQIESSKKRQTLIGSVGFRLRRAKA